MDAQDQLIGRGASGGRIKQMHRCFTEGEHHLTGALGQPFAGAHIERNPLPAPVVDEQLHRHVGLGGAVGIHTGFMAVSGQGRFRRTTGSVLATDAAVPGFELIGQAGGLQHLGLFVADGFRVKAPGRFHGGDRQHLGQVVLHHVPQGTGRFVVPGPFLHANRFSGGDLNTGDVIAVPDRLEDRVGKAQNHDVLDGFLAQVMVDAKDLVLLTAGLHHAIEGLGTAVVASEGFLDHHPAAFGVLQQASVGQ